METTQKKQMQWYMFITFLSLFIIVSALTILALFFGFGQLQEKYQDKLMWAFVLEIGAAVVALFYSIFDLKKPTSQALNDPQKENESKPIESPSLTSNEKRIFRALMDEPHGRLIANYTQYYKKELKSLLNTGKVEKQDDGRYKLTDSGLKTALSYINAYSFASKDDNV